MSFTPPQSYKPFKRKDTVRVSIPKTVLVSLREILPNYDDSTRIQLVYDFSLFKPESFLRNIDQNLSVKIYGKKKPPFV